MIRNPLLEALVPETSSDLESNGVSLEQSDALPAATSRLAQSKLWKCVLLFTAACCITLLARPTAVTTYFFEAFTGSEAHHGELRRVTHAPVSSTTGNGTILPREVASYLHRTSFHFQPEKNWMNDPNGSCCIDHNLDAFLSLLLFFINN